MTTVSNRCRICNITLDDYEMNHEFNICKDDCFDPIWWLDSMGGRTLEDVKTDSIGRHYIFMHDGHGYKERVYLPKEFQVTCLDVEI